MKLFQALLASLFVWASLAHAFDRHALLIGIGAYSHPNELDGPPHDVEAMRSLLVGQYGYDPRYVHVLVDKQATKQAILQAMTDLVKAVRAGDYVFFYYSGHGTSYYGKGQLNKGIPEETGASLPVDFSQSSLAAFGQSVLLGSELRPFFKELDGKAQVFAIYDSCYSEDAMKALRPAKLKYVSLRQLFPGVSKGDLDDAEAGEVNAGNSAAVPLPYRQLIAISAAKRDQAAADLGAEALRLNPHATFDGKPHGQLTNAIMVGLQGAADKNHDGTVSHEELFNYVNELSASGWHHNPKLLLSPDSAALQQPALASNQRVSDTSCRQAPARKSRVSVSGDLLEEIGENSTQVAEGWDIKAVARGDKFILYDAGGVQINNEPLTRPQAIARLRAESVIEQLSELRYCQQKFNVQLELNPPDRGRYLEGQKIDFSVKLDRAAYLLVIDIDQEGAVTVIYPGTTLSKLAAGLKHTLTKSVVSSPYGVDLIKAFAFENKPAGFDGFTTRPDGRPILMHPGDPALYDLLKMVASDSPERSETRIRLITSAN
jgi:Caspase domain